MILRILILFLCAFSVVNAQTLNAYESAGDEAFEKADYYNAVYYYEQVLKSRQKAGIYYKYAEACRQSYAYKKAEAAYKAVIESEEKNRFDKVEYYYALTLKHNAKYDEAAKYFESFSKSPASKGYFRDKAMQELASCTLAKYLVENPSDTVSIERLGDNINTEYSDFACHEDKEAGKLIYSSLRFDRKAPKEEKPDANRLISKILSAASITGSAFDVALLSSDEKHSANSCLSSDAMRLYFTRCSGNNSDSVICKIFMSRRTENNGWSAPIALKGSLNQGNFTYTQPNISKEDESEWLYFVSDMPGGLGGNDIWRVKMLNDTLTDVPENLGAAINSVDHEASPFYHSKSNRLYFSSQWHQGLGGYDVFFSEKKEGQFTEAINLGVPINSAANDFYWVLNRDDSSGYFASNRSGSMTITEESCCNDIYKFTYSSKIGPKETPLTSSVPADTIVLVEIVEEATDTQSILAIVPVPEKESPTVDILNSMLPIKLYFHNDEPDSNVTRTYTLKPYEEPYGYYLSLQNTYVKEHSAQFSGELKIAAEQKVNNFFENEVKAEFAKMNTFFDAMLQLLEKRQKLEIQIRGFTSPRSYSSYNIALGHRRVMSLKNQIKKHQDGIFQPYLKNGNLVIQELSFGETKSPKGISDAFNDPKNSIFSVEASRERRVEIVFLKGLD